MTKTTLFEVKRERLNDWTLSHLLQEEDGTDFYEEGDYYAVWELRKYDDDGKLSFSERAVYCDKAQGGMLICLDERIAFGLGLCDDGYDAKIAQLLQQEALDLGFPLHHPSKGLTWRELANAINKLPAEFLDTTAYVFRRDGGGTVAKVRYIEPWCTRYDGTIPGPGGEEDNCFYIYATYDDEEDY